MTSDNSNNEKVDDDKQSENGTVALKCKDADSDVDELAKSVEEKVHVSTSATTTETKKSKDKKETSKEQEDEFPEYIHQAAEWIRDAKKILIVSGAGVSVAAGIPDFRTPGTGLYDNLSKYNLPYPEAVFDVQFYAHSPQPFVSLASELWPGQGKIFPTLTHHFIALLSSNYHNQLLRNYTQNIDGLEHLANVPDQQLIECHGHFRTASCIRCGRSTRDGIESIKSIIVEHKQPPKCQQCNGRGNYVKPDIVFFGEGLPDRFHNHLRKDVSEADLCLVLGTSLQVAPVSHIPEMVNCRRILINREHVGNIGADPKAPKYRQVLARSKDLFVPGDCDTSIQQIAQVLGWKDDLLAMYEATKDGKTYKTCKEKASTEATNEQNGNSKPNNANGHKSKTTTSCTTNDDHDYGFG